MSVPWSEILGALKLPLRVLLGIALASLVTLLLHQWNWIDLGMFGRLAAPSVVLLCVVTFALSVTGLAGLYYDTARQGRKENAFAMRRKVRSEELEARRGELRNIVIKRLDYLDSDELHYLADCLRLNTQSFKTWVHSPAVSTLMTKGLVSPPGTPHHEDHYPFTIDDFVWGELLRRKEEFIAKDDKNRKEAVGNRRR